MFERRTPEVMTLTGTGMASVGGMEALDPDCVYYGSLSIWTYEENETERFGYIVDRKRRQFEIYIEEYIRVV